MNWWFVAVLLLLLPLVHAVDNETNTSFEKNVYDFDKDAYLAEEKEAYIALLSAEQTVDQMNLSGFGTFYVRDLLVQGWNAYYGENISKLKLRAQNLMTVSPELAAIMFESISEAENTDGKVGENYTLVHEKVSEIERVQERAVLLLDDIEFARFELEDAMNLTPEANFTSASLLLETASHELKKERYERVEELINQTYVSVDDAIIEASWINAKLKASQRNMKNYIIEHVIGISIGLVVFVLFVLILINESFIGKKKRLLIEMDVEKKVLERLKYEAEKNYFQYKNIPKKIYEIKVERYKERLLGLTEEKPLVEGELKKFFLRRKWYVWFRK